MSDCRVIVDTYKVKTFSEKMLHIWRHYYFSEPIFSPQGTPWPHFQKWKCEWRHDGHSWEVSFVSSLGVEGQLFSGDQLTVERDVNAISSVANGYTTEEGLEGINLQLGDWHPPVNLLSVCVDSCWVESNWILSSTLTRSWSPWYLVQKSFCIVLMFRIFSNTQVKCFFLIGWYIPFTSVGRLTLTSVPFLLTANSDRWPKFITPCQSGLPGNHIQDKGDCSSYEGLGHQKKNKSSSEVPSTIKPALNVSSWGASGGSKIRCMTLVRCHHMPLSENSWGYDQPPQDATEEQNFVN